jgi:hypothetical protein
MSFNKSNYSIGTLFRLVTPSNLTLRYQNFFTDNSGVFLFNSESYNYLPIAYDPPNRNITGNNQDVQIALPLLPEIINILIGNNYFKYSVIDAYIISLDFPVTPVLSQDRLVISSYQITDSGDSGGVILIAQSPFNAVNGQFPRLVYTTGLGNISNDIAPIGYLPELPLAGVRGF